MKIVIGLGNPGEKYKNNRHNVGHMLVDSVSRSQYPIPNIQLKKTNTFMNESGGFVKKNKPEDLDNLFIAHDDLDIPLGQYKIQFGVGPKVHNGVASVEKELGTKDFWRIRIGIDNRNVENRTDGEDYVLDDFTGEELKTLEEVYAKIGNDIGEH